MFRDTARFFHLLNQRYHYEHSWYICRACPGSWRNLGIIRADAGLFDSAQFLGSHVSLGKSKPAKFIYNIYLVVMRGTPLILQVLFMYFGLNLAGIHIGRFESALLSFVLNYTAYFSEIFRGGIQSINRGQYEAASVLGLSRGLTMRKIVIPRYLRSYFPPWERGNQSCKGYGPCEHHRPRRFAKDRIFRIHARGQYHAIGRGGSFLSGYQCDRISRTEKDRKAHELLQDLR